MAGSLQRLIPLPGVTLEWFSRVVSSARTSAAGKSGLGMYNSELPQRYVHRVAIGRGICGSGDTMLRPALVKRRF